MKEGEYPKPSAVCDGGDLDCGSGLLLIIRDHMNPLLSGDVLELRSREISVKEDLPAWCRMVGHDLLGIKAGEGKSISYFIRKKGADPDREKDLETARNFKWTTRLRWKEGMTATAYVRNHSFLIGQPASFDTGDLAPSALEYLLSALGACLIVGFQWRASQSNIEIFNLEISLNAKADNILVFLGIEDEGHPGLADVEGVLYVEADAEDETLSQIWRETLKRSPVANSLLRTAKLSLDWKRA